MRYKLASIEERYLTSLYRVKPYYPLANAEELNKEIDSLEAKIDEAEDVLSIVKKKDSFSCLDKDVIYDMFSYYPIIAYELANDFVDDFDNRCWQTFRVFAKSMIQIKKMKERKQ